LQLTNLVTTDAVADVLPHDPSTPMAELKSKPESKSVQDRFVSSSVEDPAVQPARSTKTAEATVPTGGSAAPAPAQAQK
jgi:hypothetical protein